MAVLDIKIYPDPILSQKAEDVKEITADVRKLAQDMIETIIAKEGVGLAAPQVDVSKRIIVVQTEKGPAIFINPEIKKASKEHELIQEGCLSLPGIWLDVERAKRVEIEAMNLSGKKIKIKAKDFMARIFQHEIDHLNGILICLL